MFIDTSGWFALQVAADEYAPEAARIWPWILTTSRTPVTSNHVIGEAYTLLRSSRGFREAAGFIEFVQRMQRLRVEHVSDEIESRTYAILRQYRDHDFSFVDGTSFALMHALGIREAFSFDAHFASAGFVRLGIDTPLR